MRYLKPTILTFLLIILPLTACHRGEDAAVEEKPVVEGHVAKVTTGAVPAFVVARGEATRREAAANLAAARAAHARNQRLLAEGAIPQKDVEASAARLAGAEGEHRVAEQTLRAQRQAVSLRDLQMAQSRVEQARARLAAAEAQRSYATIRSPLAGVVAEQFLYEGETRSEERRVGKV